MLTVKDLRKSSTQMHIHTHTRTHTQREEKILPLLSLDVTGLCKRQVFYSRGRDLMLSPSFVQGEPCVLHFYSFLTLYLESLISNTEKQFLLLKVRGSIFLLNDT